MDHHQGQTLADDTDQLALRIAAIVAQNLRNKDHRDRSSVLEALRGGSLRIEGFLSSSSTSDRQIHLGTVQIPTNDDDRNNYAHNDVPAASSDHSIRRHDGASQLSSRGGLPTNQSHEPSTLAENGSPDSSGRESGEGAAIRRKTTAGLRMQRVKISNLVDVEDSSAPRRLDAARTFPQRKKTKSNEVTPALQPTSTAKLVNGIWEQIYGGTKFDLAEIFGSAALEWPARGLLPGPTRPDSAVVYADLGYNEMNAFCKKVTQASRCARALEVVVQARWIECFDARIQSLLSQNLDLSLTKVKMLALKEACEDFKWTEKEMRNKMAVWRGYKELKDAGGWVVLVFAGMGIYRFCKYRGCSMETVIRELEKSRSKFDVAADTLHPTWRQLLAVVGDSTERRYTGHPHDWVVSDSYHPVPLKNTYLQYDPHFQFRHIEESIIDANAWDGIDPRALALDTGRQTFFCDVCDELQSNDHQINACQCYPTIFGGRKAPSPTQVTRTTDGRNNGLVCNLPFERGQGIGEFVGLIVKALRDKDVMQGQSVHGRYQIYQGSMGNHTKFVNHSCVPNSQFERFNWLGTQRVVLVSKGIEAGEEITVDYSDDYWRNLDKICLCGHSSCRYLNRRQVT